MSQKIKRNFSIIKDLKENIKAVKDKDPASSNSLDIFFHNPGIKAIFRHRIAHFFYNKKMFFIANSISYHTRKKTGIEIHPGAVLGRRICIDHGMGIVIGETATVGDDVLIYHNVTLGGTGKDKGKRHPDVGNNVLLSSGCKILGPIQIGNNAKVGANAVVVKPVPDYATAVGMPARNIERKYKGDLKNVI
ncbi:serine O-acetyltransferase EpsC [Peptoniphilus stercorisuis]|uniref:Serine acetyltransferase n=1 Tax=Peptoniphilus stercorisuis TaxID=1436965 RepID=A0ABS4KDU9_9FIRM|nr:serine O-acetyltransferase EpsC [Peptoniphilus stercorisuis]MBP2025461.1 serine O-acetyltransferase [Peptoniphilus stercorisuis]